MLPLRPAAEARRRASPYLPGSGPPCRRPRAPHTGPPRRPARPAGSTGDALQGLVRHAEPDPEVPGVGRSGVSGPPISGRGPLAARTAASGGQQESAQGLFCSRRRFRSAAIRFFALLRTLLAGMGRPLRCGLWAQGSRAASRLSALSFIHWMYVLPSGSVSVKLTMGSFAASAALRTVSVCGVAVWSL
jgi:hypothetical protein